VTLSGPATVLLPVDVSAAEPATGDLFDRLHDVDVVVLGYYPVPNQAAPAQAKRDHESDASRRLDGVVERLRERGCAAEGTLVFTHDRDETVDRAAEEYGADAVLTPGDATGFERVLVAVRGTENLDRICSLTATLLADSDATVTLFHATDGGEGSPLDAAVDRLVAAGVAPDRIETNLSETGAPRGEILDLAGEFDALVLGETEPSLRERILGRVPSRVVDETDRPTFVVRDVD